MNSASVSEVGCLKFTPITLLSMDFCMTFPIAFIGQERQKMQSVLTFLHHQIQNQISLMVEVLNGLLHILKFVRV